MTFYPINKNDPIIGMSRRSLPSELLEYLAALPAGNGDTQRVPPISVLSAEIGIGVSKLREQLEVAKALGLVEVRPRTGIRLKPYDFLPAVSQSLLYAVVMDRGFFDMFADLRKRVEAAYWYEAVDLLTPEDHQTLQNLMQQAWDKLNGSPIRIPHFEHRQLHLTIFSRLENPFVRGILEAYWDAYEAVELDSYTDLTYLREVWTYHQRIVDAIQKGDREASFQNFIDHADLLRHRPITTG